MTRNGYLNPRTAVALLAAANEHLNVLVGVRSIVDAGKNIALSQRTLGAVGQLGLRVSATMKVRLLGFKRVRNHFGRSS